MKTIEKSDKDSIVKLLERIIIEQWEFITKKGPSLINIREKQYGLVAHSLAITAYTVFLIKLLGIWVGSLVSIIVSFLILNNLKKISNDEKLKTNTFKKTNFIKFMILIIAFYLFYANFHTYLINPEITITSPRSGDTVIIDKDNTYCKISGNSKGLANNQFLHLFILHRRVDSNQPSGEWDFDYSEEYGGIVPWAAGSVLRSNPCTVYSDGSWECRIQLHKLYVEQINETLIVKSPSDSSNNISTNVDIVAIIIKQSIKHSILTKLLTRMDEIDDVDGPDWYKKIIFWLPTGKGTFYDPDYDSFDFEYDDWYYYPLYYLPKHLADDHVTITPLIVEPFNLTSSPQESSSPYGLQVCIYPWMVPADNVTTASVKVQLIDSVGNYVHSEGRILNITCTRGNLSIDHIITNSQGCGAADITSGELGEGLILVQSHGLNNGTGQITYTLPPVVLEFNKWLMSSPGDDETSERTANFQTMHDAEYSVVLTGWGTEAHWPFKPDEWPIVRVEVDGIILEDIEIASGSGMEVPIGNAQLNAGNHTLRVNMTNNFAVPLIGERNLYVERVEFS